MAISTSSYFSNAIVGVPGAGADVDIYEVNATPKFALGTKFERQDGAVFRYGQLSAATSAGTLVASTPDETAQVYILGMVVAASSTYAVPGEQNGIYPGAIGSRYLITYVTATLNQFAGAYLAVAGSAGQKFTYRIKGCTSTGVVASALSRFELYDPIQVAITSASAIIISPSKYNDLKIAGASTAYVAGVTVQNVNTASYFGWIQTRGVIGVTQDTAPATVLGQMAFMSTGALGAVTANGLVTALSSNLTYAAITNPIVGRFVGLGSASNLALVDLSIE